MLQYQRRDTGFLPEQIPASDRQRHFLGGAFSGGGIPLLRKGPRDAPQDVLWCCLAGRTCCKTFSIHISLFGGDWLVDCCFTLFKA